MRVSWDKNTHNHLQASASPRAVKKWVHVNSVHGLVQEIKHELTTYGYFVPDLMIDALFKSNRTFRLQWREHVELTVTEELMGRAYESLNPFVSALDLKNCILTAQSEFFSIGTQRPF